VPAPMNDCDSANSAVLRLISGGMPAAGREKGWWMWEMGRGAGGSERFPMRFTVRGVRCALASFVGAFSAENRKPTFPENALLHLHAGRFDDTAVAREIALHARLELVERGEIRLARAGLRQVGRKLLGLQDRARRVAQLVDDVLRRAGGREQ